MSLIHSGRSDSDLLYQRRRDHRLPQPVPLCQGWTESLGLAAIIDDLDDVAFCGRHSLYRNEQVTWLALRGRQPGRNGRGFRRSFTGTTQATLRYGMPSICFVAPLRESAPVLAVLRKLSAAVAQSQSRHHPSPGQWMPRPYLAFDRRECRRLFDLATDCTLGDIPPKPRFLLPFRRGLCRAVAEGLPLHAGTDLTYVGPVHGRAKPVVPKCDQVGLAAHELRSESGHARILHLPRQARLLARPGQRMAAGEIIAKALPREPTLYWRQMDLADQWRMLPEVCGGVAVLRYLRMLWFHDQALELPGQPGRLLYPAELVSLAAREARPSELWWDFERAGAMDLYDMELSVAVFPPLSLSGLSQPSFSLPGEVLLDAGIANPRFRSARTRQVPLYARRRKRIAVAARGARHACQPALLAG